MTQTPDHQHNDGSATAFKDEERYRLLVDSITDYAIFMLDENGFVTSWNPGARRFKGYEFSEIIGEHFSRFYTDEDRKAGLGTRAKNCQRESAL
jgi:PAS domain S-box-containing protein